MQTYYYFTNELYHHGIKGQRWGVRRFQNEDGTLTEKGRRRYGEDLDINDTSRQNVANIRYGEARRKYEAAKLAKADRSTRRELKSRVKEAKRIKKSVKYINEGEKLVREGKSIAFNEAKINREKNKQIFYELFNPDVRNAPNDAPRNSATYVYEQAKRNIRSEIQRKNWESQRKVRDLQNENRNIKAYEDAKRDLGSVGAKGIGGKEYRDVLERRGKK